MENIFLHKLHEQNSKGCFPSKLHCAFQGFDLEMWRWDADWLIKDALSFDGKLIVIITTTINAYKKIISFLSQIQSCNWKGFFMLSSGDLSGSGSDGKREAESKEP